MGPDEFDVARENLRILLEPRGTGARLKREGIVNQATLSGFVNGHDGIGLDKLSAVARALGVSLNEIMTPGFARDLASHTRGIHNSLPRKEGESDVVLPATGGSSVEAKIYRGTLLAIRERAADTIEEIDLLLGRQDQALGGDPPAPRHVDRPSGRSTAAAGLKRKRQRQR